MDRALPITEHFNELRHRIIVCLAALGIGTACCLPFASVGLTVLKYPAAGLIKKLVFFSPQDGFLVYVHIALLSGLILSLPVILYQVWMFIEPALGERIRKYSICFVSSCFVMFVGGCLFAYFLLIPPALKFLLGFAGDQLESVISVQRYISFVTSLVLACGLVFQMPLLSLILTKLGVIKASELRKKHRGAVVAVFVAAAVITPTPDVFNMFLLALPMLLLYELSIGVSFLAGPKWSRSLQMA